MPSILIRKWYKAGTSPAPSRARTPYAFFTFEKSILFVLSRALRSYADVYRHHVTKVEYVGSRC